MRKLIFALTAFAFIAFTGNAFATSNGGYGTIDCQPIYGGGETCETSNKFVLDKKVLHPTKTKGNVEVYVDNLTINDPKYAPGQTIKFQLSVTNTGSSKLDEVTFTDYLPNYVEFVSGPGTFDSNSNKLTYKIENINSNETKRFIIVAKVKGAGSLPNTQNTVCVVNQASVTFGKDESRDNSQFCIEQTTTTKGGLPVMPAPKMTQTPSTGAESLALIGLIPAAVGGLFLRRRSK